MIKKIRTCLKYLKTKYSKPSILYKEGWCLDMSKPKLIRKYYNKKIIKKMNYYDKWLLFNKTYGLFIPWLKVNGYYSFIISHFYYPMKPFIFEYKIHDILNNVIMKQVSDIFVLEEIKKKWIKFYFEYNII